MEWNDNLTKALITLFLVVIAWFTHLRTLSLLRVKAMMYLVLSILLTKQHVYKLH